MANEIKKQLGLGDLRRRANLTQRKLADKLDITIKTVSAWERGEHGPRLTLDETVLLMETLQCSLDELIVAMQRDNGSEREELRLTFAQIKQLTQVCNCSVQELAELIRRLQNDELYDEFHE